MRLPSILDDLSVGVARGLGDRQRCAALRQFQSERYIFDGLDAVEPTGVVGVEEDVDAVAQTFWHHLRLTQGGRQGGVVGVGFSFRRLPGLAAVHDLVADGAIGDVQSFTAWYNADYGSSPDAPFGWRYAKDTAGAGALIDIGTHAIDTVQHVLGPIRRVVSATLQTVITRRPIPGSSDFGTVDTDDIALLTVELENGAIGQIHASRVAVGIPNSLGLQVHGSTGHARFDSIAAGEFHVHLDDNSASLAGPRRVFAGPAHPYFSDVAAMPGGGVGTGYAEAFVAEIQHFVRCILADEPMDTSFASALRVMRVVDAAIEAADTQSAVLIAEPAHA